MHKASHSCSLDRLARCQDKIELLIWSVIGYALHILPFGVLERQAFMHYYLPAYYFALLALVTVFDMLPTTIKRVAICSFSCAVIWTFQHVLPLSLGSSTLNYDQFLARAQLMTGECWYLSKCWCSSQ